MSSGQGPEDGAAAWTVDELMIATLAATLDNDDQACNGMASFIPVIAFQLARLTHAPDLVWLASSIGLDARPDRVPASTLEAPLWRDSTMYLEQYSTFWDIVLNGRWLQKFCVGAAQLDRYGNGNNSVIGDVYNRPKVRLPGTAGLGDMGSIGKRLFYWSMRFSAWDSCCHLGLVTKKMEEAFYPGVGVFANWNNFKGRFYVPTGGGGAPPLHEAVRGDQAELSRDLLTAGADAVVVLF